MIILVSGHNGRIGRLIIPELIRKGISVKTLGRKPLGNIENFTWELGQKIPKDVGDYDIFLHLAFNRSSYNLRNVESNLNISSLLEIRESILPKSRLVMPSSLSINPRNKSVYSKVKYLQNQYIISNFINYTILTLGFVIDKNFFDIQPDVIKRLAKYRIEFRLLNRNASFFYTTPNHLLDCITKITNDSSNSIIWAASHRNFDLSTFFDFGKKFSIKIPIWLIEIKIIYLFFEKLRFEKTIPFIDQMVSLSSVNKLDDMAFSFEFNKLIPRNEQIIIKE